MLITVKPGFDPPAVERELVASGLWVERLASASRVHFLVRPGSRELLASEIDRIRRHPGVEDVAAGPRRHARLDAMARPVIAGGVEIGPGRPPVLAAGPCSVESEEAIERVASRVAALGARFLRGGAFKPRTSPYSFQGHGERALAWLREAADRHALSVITEVMDGSMVRTVARVADLLQIGSRNMANYSLLVAAARSGRPILLKRGMAATVEEWFLAAEYCLVHGAPGVVFCERGIRGFDGETRHVLDLGAVALVAHVHGLPVWVDPSHATGRRDLVIPLSRAALAAGACGLVVETHDDPGRALSDGPQALSSEEMTVLARELVGLSLVP